MPDTPASADMTEQGERDEQLAQRFIAGFMKPYLAWNTITNIDTDNLKQRFVELLGQVRADERALASARAEGVSKSEKEIAEVWANDAYIVTTPQAAETGGEQACPECGGRNMHYRKCMRGMIGEIGISDPKLRQRPPSHDDADARGREIVQELFDLCGEAADIGQGFVALETLADKSMLNDWSERAERAANWIEAALPHLRSTPPPSADDAKARELAEWFDNAAEATLFFKLPYRNQWELYLSKAECQLVVSRLRIPAAPSPDPLLAELFAPGGRVVVTWSNDNGHQELLRTKVLTDAQRAAIYSAMSGGGGAEVSEEE